MQYLKHICLFLVVLLLIPVGAMAARLKADTDPCLDMLLALVLDPESQYPLPQSRITTFGAGEFQKYKNDGIELDNYNGMAQFDTKKGTVILCGEKGTVRNVRYWRRLTPDVVSYNAYVILGYFETILSETNNRFVVILTLDNRRLTADNAGDAESLHQLLERRLFPEKAAEE